MELRHLRYFVAVAEELNFRRAADRLRVAQPALSSQIKNLEQELGVKLFDRTTRSVSLTPTGQIFLGEARGILGATAHAEQLVKKAELGLVGTLRLGVITPATGPLLARVLRHFHQKFTGVRISNTAIKPAAQLKRMRAGELDAGLLRPPVVSPDLDTRFVEQAPLMLAVPAGHRLAKKKKLEWMDFNGEGLVMIHPDLQHSFYDPFIAACVKAGAKTHVAQYAQDVQIKMWLISAGFGIAPVTATLVEIRRPGVIFRPLPPGLPPVQTMLAWRRADVSIPVIKNFLDCFNFVKA